MALHLQHELVAYPLWEVTWYIEDVKKPDLHPAFWK
jgi:hypothetical protein